MQTIGSMLFAISYFMLYEFTGAAINIISFLGTLLLYFGEKFRKWYFLAIVLALFVSTLCFTFNGIKSLLPFVAQSIALITLWTNNGKAIRVFRVAAVSPLWLIYNIIVFSAGGILCESFNIVSVIASFFRFSKKGFQK